MILRALVFGDSSLSQPPSLLAAWQARVSKVAAAEQTVGTAGQPPLSPIP